jgi:hypothetical protein
VRKIQKMYFPLQKMVELKKKLMVVHGTIRKLSNVSKF